MIYWLHRIFHSVPYLSNLHQIHHNHVTNETGTLRWDWKNIFIWVDDWRGTLDQWIMEVIPTIIFCWVFNQWWLLAFYWFWSAFIQERIEHNSNIDYYPILTSGKWHLIHHKDETKNFGVFFPIWDIIFKTNGKK
jgi:sterol desaturase/sphingolipid hydroxylase (fatty acid hydroxylase superfamily)